MKGKVIRWLVISGLALMIIINVALIIINQGLIVSMTFNYCTIKAVMNIEECLRIQSFRLTGIFIPLIISIVLHSVILIELVSKNYGKRIWNVLNDVKDENELMASPLTAALTTRYFLSIPFHVWDLGFTIGFIIGSIIGSGILRFICVLTCVWCGVGTVIDYQNFRRMWKK